MFCIKIGFEKAIKDIDVNFWNAGVLIFMKFESFLVDRNQCRKSDSTKLTMKSFAFSIHLEEGFSISYGIFMPYKTF